METTNREDHIPLTGGVRTRRRLKANRERPHLSLSLSQDFVSRPKLRHPLQISSRARSSYLHPSLLYFCFSSRGDARGNGEQQRTLFWHDGEIFPPKMAKK